jgi:hypothetical protein
VIAHAQGFAEVPFLGALIAFVWSAIAHQNPLTMALGLSVFGPKEDAVLAALKSNVTEPGLYFFRAWT